MSQMEGNHLQKTKKKKENGKEMQRKEISNLSFILGKDMYNVFKTTMERCYAHQLSKH